MRDSDSSSVDPLVREQEERMEEVDEIRSMPPSMNWSILKTLAACALLYSAAVTWNTQGDHRRRLSMVGDGTPSYMEALFQDLRERKKLFDETPPEEVKYWFEYTGPLQVRTTEITVECGFGRRSFV